MEEGHQLLDTTASWLKRCLRRDLLRLALRRDRLRADRLRRGLRRDLLRLALRSDRLRPGRLRRGLRRDQLRVSGKPSDRLSGDSHRLDGRVRETRARLLGLLPVVGGVVMLLPGESSLNFLFNKQNSLCQCCRGSHEVYKGFSSEGSDNGWDDVIEEASLQHNCLLVRSLGT